MKNIPLVWGMVDEIGVLEIVDFMNMDASLKTVNVARASFGKRKKVYDNIADKRLLNYLAKHEHTSPFRHSYVTFYVHAPEFVARQWWKHIVGGDYSFKDTGWNELSLRYTKGHFFFEPETFYLQSADKKQGRDETPHPNSSEYKSRYKEILEEIQALYNDMVENGISMEQARMVLPLSVYTSFYWTASLQAIHHFVRLRNKPDAQAEIREYAEAMRILVKPLFGDAWEALDSHY